MSQRLNQLLVKALNGLPPDEQGELLGELLGRQTAFRPHPLLDGPPVGPGRPDSGPISVAAVRMIELLRSTGNPAFPQPGQEAALKVLPIRLPTATYDRLRAWSKAHDFSMAVIVRTLVERFLDDQDGDERPTAEPAD